MCTLWHSLYYVSLYCQWYELMLTLLFNFDHLANSLRIHNALFKLNAYLRDWLRILKKILWCFLWFDDLNILEILTKYLNEILIYIYFNYSQGWFLLFMKRSVQFFEMRYNESSIFFITEREIIHRHLRMKEKCVGGDKKSVTWHVSPDQQPPVSGGAQKQVTINLLYSLYAKNFFLYNLVDFWTWHIL